MCEKMILWFPARVADWKLERGDEGAQGEGSSYSLVKE